MKPRTKFAVKFLAGYFFYVGLVVLVCKLAP